MNYKGLKEYQREALAAFGAWWKELRDRREECVRRAAALQAQGLSVRPDDRDYPAMAWDALAAAGKLPRVKGRDGEATVAAHVSRTDGRGEPIPHACLKVPTGGGKTLLGAAMVEKLGPERGVVLWITPSRAIFQQTWDVLSDRTHNCRQRLERACNGRVKLMRKDEVLSALAVESQLCVMPVMLQATGNSRGGDFLKMFRDSSNLPYFFPDMDDIPANAKMLSAHPDLDAYDLGDSPGEIGAGAVKHSLFNALKLVRPIVVLDEAQKAYTALQREKLCALNPRMILELSATPKLGASNILVNIPGADLQKEQMIKLPLEVHHLDDSTWRATLISAKERLDELEGEARKLRGGDGRYIRPMMLVRVERVSEKLRDGIHVHAEDVREFLLQLPGAKSDLVLRSEQVRVRTSEKDELGREDLLSPECPVRCVITKDALREGWDCPFAYILVLLDATTAPGALTQMTGRILRQPDAKWTGTILDRSYVYCFNRGVKSTVAQIKKGLESEGMPDLKDWIRGGDETADAPPKRIKTIRRRDEFAGREIFLPVVLHRYKRKFRPLDYEADILRYVDWKGIADTDLKLSLESVDKMVETIVEVDFVGRGGRREVREVESDEGLSLVFFARYLGEVIPNPWLAADVAKKTLDSLRKKAGGDEGLFKRRFRIAEAIKSRVAEMVDRDAERVFSEKLAKGDIRLQLAADGAGFSFPAETTIAVGEDESPLTGGDDEPLEKSLYGRVYDGGLTSLERAFAVYADAHKAVAWWHRLAANRDGYALQGWRRRAVYPDFVVCVGEGKRARILILETKGKHLSGNEDTQFKQALLDKLTATNPRALERGDFALKSGDGKRPMILRVLPQKGWREEFDKLAAE